MMLYSEWFLMCPTYSILTIDSCGDKHVVAEVESQVDVQIHLAVKKNGGRVGCACKKTCKIFLPPVVGKLTLGG
jgi:hypothetical protein